MNSSSFSSRPENYLSGEAYTLSGVVFHPEADTWAYIDSLMAVNIDFNKFPVSRELVHSAKSVMRWYAENSSPSHLSNMFNYFLRFLRFISAETNELVPRITQEHILSYNAFLQPDSGYRLGSIADVFQKWIALQLVGVDMEVGKLMKKMKFKGNEKGRATLTMDPEEGPFIDLEFEAIHAGLKFSYEEGNTSLEDYLLAWLVIGLGQRGRQYAALKLCDFYIEQNEDGIATYFLRVPRCKQRGQVLRDSFKVRPLVPDIGVKLEMYVSDTEKRFRGILSNTRNAPLFPHYQHRRADHELFQFHLLAGEFGNRFQRIMSELKLYSGRTGKPIHYNVTRFRRTYGTRMAAEGYGACVIAENLDHSDTQNVGVYIEAVPAIVERIDRALAMQLAPLAQAFVGKIIANESEATRGSDPESRIWDPRLGSHNTMGSCGRDSFCGELAPLACYTCKLFQPWAEGPHEAVLQHLLSERERLANGNDLRIASISDRTILAVAEVVRLCALKKEERNG